MVEGHGNEIRSIIKYRTWDVVECSMRESSVGSRFVLSNKCNPYGSLLKRKSRMVARSFSQQPGVDFYESFAPVACLGPVKLMIAMAAQYNVKIYQYDVSTAYLNGVLDENVFMDMP